MIDRASAESDGCRRHDSTNRPQADLHVLNVCMDCDQVWLAKLRPEQPTAFSLAVVLTLGGVPGFQASAFAMLKVQPANTACNCACKLSRPVAAVDDGIPWHRPSLLMPSHLGLMG